MTITCNGCGRDFPVDPYYVDTLRDGDLEVQYFICPACRTRYHILTTDTTMRQLIQKRKALAAEVKAAQAKGFRKGAFRKYRERMDQIKAEQMKALPTLTKRGEEILGRSVHNAGTLGKARLQAEGQQAQESNADQAEEDSDL